MPRLDEIIDGEVQALALARANLGTLVHALQCGLDALKADHMAGIREAIDEAGAAWQALEAQIKANPLLFVKPRTAVAHAIKFGLAKGQGSMEIPDPEKTLLLIRKHLPEQAQALIDVKETPRKEALEKLAAADLKRIAVHVVSAGDRVVIKPADGEIDKLVKALVKAKVDEE